ncbi:MAG: SpoIIE family protein phosphatase, partial [Flavobacteriales bacterium]|nr:SpoIIE family protein phosphatase [Flavobacteriales bacterium]
MSMLKEMWMQLSNIGLSTDMDDRLSRKIKLTNQICLVACVMTLGQIGSMPHIGGFVLLCIICTLAYTLTWALNHFKYYRFSRIYFCTVSSVGLLIVSSTLSDEPNIAFKFIILQAVVLPLIVFDKRDKWLSIVGVGIYAICLAVMNMVNSSIPKLAGVDSEMFENPNIITFNSVLVILNLYLGYRYLQNLNYAAEEGLAESLDISNKQREIIESKNKDIQDSINYAQRIQRAILPDKEDIKINLPDHFVYYNPKEKIGGDFYWYGETGNHIIFASVDCTGHGTPGALISIIGSKLLDKIVKEHGITNPAEILELMNLDIISTLHSEWNIVSDGMDVTLLSIDTWQQKVTFAGAKNSLLIIRDGKIQKVRGDRASIGDIHILEDGFTNHEFK